MKQLPRTAYGLLMTFDGYGASSARCTDTGRLYRFLYDLPHAIGMRRLGFPHIVRVDEPGVKGLSGFVFLMESHVSIHTYAERGFVTADVYSCKAFDTDAATDLFAAFFSVASHETHTHVRGTRFGSSSHPRQRKRSGVSD